MRVLLRIVLWFGATVTCLFVAISAFGQYSATPGMPGLVRQEINSFKNRPVTFAALPHVAFEIKTALAQEDARPLVIERYFTDHSSPMAGLGDTIVQTADHYNLDPYLVVAIAQQESNLGKLMPPDCHNAWGWGIHSAGTLCFDDWQEGINTFISGMASKYLAYGLHTPEEIMTRYNATSPGGAWAKGVNQFLEELHSGNW